MTVEVPTDTAAERPSTGSLLHYVPGLDGYRALAALMVLVFHVAGATSRTDPDGFTAVATRPLGALGVSLFFVLSGFLLYRPFVGAHLRDEQVPDVGRYFFRRALRIFPAYWLALLFYIAVFSRPEPIHGLRDGALLLTLQQGYDTDLLLAAVPVAWTLTVEVTFYVFLPLFACVPLLLAGRRAPSRDRFLVQLASITGLFALSMVLRMLLISTGAQLLGVFPAMADWFAVGMLIATLRSWVDLGHPGRRMLRISQLRPEWGLVGASLAFVGVLLLGLEGGFVRMGLGDHMARNALFAIIGLCLIGPVGLGNLGTGLMHRFLEHPLISWFGLVSYGIYLWHPLVIRELRPVVIDRLGLGPGFWSTLVITVLASAAIAAVSWYLLEHPVIGWGRRHERSAVAAPEVAGSGISRRSAITVVAAFVVASVGILAGAQVDRLPAQVDRRPNLVVILTDDQTLASLEAMPQTLAHLARAGTTFTHAFANFPLCCPARATLLTGQYAHNHGVLGGLEADGGGFGSLDHSNTLPVWMNQAGYQTAHVGKYLNEYFGPRRPANQIVPAGWDRWFGLEDPYPEGNQGYFDYRVVVGGDQTIDDVRTYGTDDADYVTDVIADRAVADITALHRSDAPFFLQVATLAPHSGHGRQPRDSVPTAQLWPAPRHEGAIDAPPPATPAVGEVDLSDKPTWVQDSASGPFGWDRLEHWRDQVYPLYLETLLAVDEAVDRIVEKLAALDELENTIIVFTSDNGWHFGEHRLVFTKDTPYEPSTRVPLLVRGPGFAAGATRDQLVGHIDIVPTLLRATGVAPDRTQDGEPLQPFATDPGYRSDRALLIANGTARSRMDHYDSVRTDRYQYTRWALHSSRGGGFEYELYDLVADPDQLQSLHDDPAWDTVEAYLARLLEQLIGCSGATCAVSASPPRPPL